MPRTFEFADSEISRIDAQPDGLHIRFAAAMLRVGDEATNLGCGNALQGYSNGVSLVLSGATVQGDIAACTGRLNDGKLLHKGERLAALPLPSQWLAEGAPLRLDLQCANGAWLQVDAQQLRCEEAADARFVEVFKC